MLIIEAFNRQHIGPGIPESSESPQTSRAIARLGMDEFARRLQEKEQATEKKLQETISRAEQLQEENAELRRVTCRILNCMHGCYHGIIAKA